MVPTKRKFGFPFEKLQAAFDAVSDPEDWRGPISAWVRGEEVKLVVAAIRFYTATESTVRLDTNRMRYLVESVGYRAGRAGDH